jgi:hypothetical protein
MSKYKGRVAAIAITAGIVVGLANIPATAANQPERNLSSKPAANTVTSATVVNGSLYQQDINKAVWDLLRTPSGGTVTSWSIKDGTIEGRDLSLTTKKVLTHTPVNDVTTVQVKDKSLYLQDLQPGLQALINAGRVTQVEADGPYPGATDLGDLEGQGDNSDALVPGDSGAAAHEVWVKCAPGKTALGGGFTLAADASLAAKKAVQVVASEPLGAAIAGDAAQSVKPTGWRVEVINNGAADVVVRPWVSCAKVS